MSKYQHLIDVISPQECDIVCKPRSDWRVKVYPPPAIWLSKRALSTRWVINKINKIRYGKKEGKHVKELWCTNS